MCWRCRRVAVALNSEQCRWGDYAYLFFFLVMLGLVAGCASPVPGEVQSQLAPTETLRVDFSPAYVEIETTYVVRKEAPLRTAGEADKMAR